MSDRARELAERIARMNNPEEITPILADALELAEQGQFSRTMSHMTKKVAEAEQRGYNAGLKHAADEATHGNGQHSVEIASRILALISSSPATDTDREKRLVAFCHAACYHPPIDPKDVLAAFNESDAKRTEGK